MDTIKPSQQSLLSLKRHTLLAIFICYIPHITTEPWWLFLVFLAAIGYRLVADYFSYPFLPRWIRFFIVIGCLVILNGSIHTSGFFIRFLLTFIILKCLEIHTVRDLKVLILCNFFLIFSALIVIQDLWIILYLIIAIIANLSIMLKLSASEVSLRMISGKSSQQLLIAIPLSILLFYVFPRIDPLWQVPTLSKGSTGFSETMSPGSIAELFNDDSTVMRITFKNDPILNGYWRGIILSFYSGESWSPVSYNYFSFSPLRELRANEIADYEIILEPDQKKWLFYQGYPVAGESRLLFSPAHGIIRQNNEAVNQRIAYSLKIAAAPYHVLNQDEYAAAIQLPNNINPRLNTWAKTQFANSHKDVKVFIQFLHDYIHQQPFWYTLKPPALNTSKNQMDVFWFGTQKGFCEHYASAITFILRSAGIPARVVVGYQGGQWNPITHAITLQRNDAHAWLEYWQNGVGWQQLDPTSFIALERIDQTIRTSELYRSGEDDYLSISAMPWQQKIKFVLDSARFFSERWFLFYNQNTQQNLLQLVGLGKWNKGELLQASVGFMIVFFVFLGVFSQWRQKQKIDLLLREYHLLQKEFRKFAIAIHPAATLKQQCKLLIEKEPLLATTLADFIHDYENLRLKQITNDPKENKKETINLLKKLRFILRKLKSKQKHLS